MTPPPPHPILTQHFDSNEIALAKIDKEIANIQESLRSLRGYRNTYTVVHRVPPELLTRIFAFVQRGFTDYEGIKDTLKWLSVTHVSQHWRNVALQSPTLWSHIHKSYPRQVMEEWLKRSKVAPLSIGMRVFFPHELDFLKEDLLLRTRELRVDVQMVIGTTLSDILSSPTPILEYLSITSRDPTQLISASNTAPHLRHLQLTGCSIDINCSFLRALTSLELCNTPQRFSSSDILGILSNCPHLVSLILLDILEKGTDLLSSNNDTATLPDLQSLTFKGDSFIQDLDLLAHLSFPANTGLHFYSTATTGNATSVLVDFLRVHQMIRLSSTSSQALESPPTHLALTVSKSVNLMMDVSPQDSSYQRGFFLDFLVIIPDKTFVVSEDSEIANLLTSLPLATLTSITTNSNVNVSIEAWKKTFGRLPELNHITVTGPHASNLVSAVIEDSKTSLVRGDENTWTPIFPKLEKLDLREMTLPKPTHDLVDALRARKTVEMGIKELGMKACDSLKEILTELHVIVPRVSHDLHTRPRGDVLVHTRGWRFGPFNGEMLVDGRVGYY